MKQFTWTDELVAEFTAWSLSNSPVFQGRYADIEQFKKLKEPKPEWEILSFFDYMGQPLEFIDGKFRNETNSLGLQNCLNMGYRIRSVKRIVDSVVFTLGDMVYYKKPTNPNWVIQEFYITDKNIMLARSKDCDHVEFIDNECLLSKAPERKVLFTTEDGVEVFIKNQTVYQVGLKYEYRNLTAECSVNGGYWKTYSTEKAAENYLLMNQPLLSLKEILASFSVNWDYDSFKKHYKYLAKEKLKL